MHSSTEDVDAWKLDLTEAELQEVERQTETVVSALRRLIAADPVKPTVETTRQFLISQLQHRSGDDGSLPFDVECAMGDDRSTVTYRYRVVDRTRDAEAIAWWNLHCGIENLHHAVSDAGYIQMVLHQPIQYITGLYSVTPGSFE